MKKLIVLLQIVALLAVCPMYVFLEITHAATESSDAGLLIKPKTEIMDTQISNKPEIKTEDTPYMIFK
jgi:hypothetical protein